MMQRNLVSNVVFIRMSDNVKSNSEKYKFLSRSSEMWIIKHASQLAPELKNRHDMTRNSFVVHLT